MLQSRFKKTVLGAAACSAVTIAALAPAQAAIYVGSFDPPYGAWFPDLGWGGTSEFFIPDACVVSSGVVTFAGCAGLTGGFMTAGFAEVGLYSLSTPSTTQTLNFNQTVNVSQMMFAGGVLTGVQADFFTPVVATMAAAGGGDYAFTLSFSLDGARLFHLSQSGDSHSNGRGRGHTSHGNGNGYGHDKGCPFPPSLRTNTQACGYSAGEATAVTYVAAIPEPSTYALMLAGLAAVGFVARRRRSS